MCNTTSDENLKAHNACMHLRNEIGRVMDKIRHVARTRSQDLSSFESSAISDNFRSIPVRDSSSDSGPVNAKRVSTKLQQKEKDEMRQNKKSKYYYIPDNFSSLDQSTIYSSIKLMATIGFCIFSANSKNVKRLNQEGHCSRRGIRVESSNLIIGIDFTKSNEWTGKVSFNNKSLHAIGNSLNPYEKAISIIGKTLSPFDEDNLIPCFGFGDVTTHDQDITSYGPVVDAAVDIVERTGGQYHVLVIIADGQHVSSLYLFLVGVGDGPWEDMQKFDDRIPARRVLTIFRKRAAFALAALMEIPINKAARELGLLGYGAHY
ncbi:hypothetical protein HAX54_024878 [Datura stramonium]|uniref:Copine C-terminal domain-containing protein n=1 Tax=Datura stramonium TaxID=4076 RepID=A0ABS8S6B7_DATST|nr:hypothetical protein [Datura stramonium]